MATFCKNEHCPPSQELLAYQNGDIEPNDSREIRLHLRTCEFCAAEIDFYSHYPQTDEVVKPEKIPQPLFELAEALLSDKPDMASLFQLIKDD